MMKMWYKTLPDRARQLELDKSGVGSQKSWKKRREKPVGVQWFHISTTSAQISEKRVLKNSVFSRLAPRSVIVDVFGIFSSQSPFFSWDKDESIILLLSARLILTRFSYSIINSLAFSWFSSKDLRISSVSKPSCDHASRRSSHQFSSTKTRPPCALLFTAGVWT